MENTSTSLSAPDVVLADLPKEQHTEDIVHREPPRYGFLNPAALKVPSNGDPTPVHYQPQLGVVNNFGNTPYPYRYNGPPLMNPPVGEIESYKVWSILNIFFCCFILGFIACSYSTQTEELSQRGDVQGALNASKNARTMNIIATVVGMMVITFVVIYQVGVFH
jgi:hypothetical protein